MTSAKVLFFILVSVLVTSIGKISWDASQHNKQVLMLQNQLASRDQTIEVQKGLFKKQTLSMNDLSQMLDRKDVQLAELSNELKKTRSKLLSLTEVTVKLRKDLEVALTSGHQTDVPPDRPGDPARKKVDFDQNLSMFNVKGYTLTDPPQVSLKLSQTRPLRLSVSVAQQSDGSWKTYTTSSEEDFDVQIGLAAVNPNLLRPKWYEKIGVTGSIGGGTTQLKFGMLTGVGLSYRAGQFDIGPNVWVIAADQVSKFFGVSFVWHPFAR